MELSPAEPRIHSLYGFIAAARNDWLWRYHDEKRLIIRLLRARNRNYFAMLDRFKRATKKGEAEFIRHVESVHFGAKQMSIVMSAISCSLYVSLPLRYIAKKFREIKRYDPNLTNVLPLQDKQLHARG